MINKIKTIAVVALLVTTSTASAYTAQGVNCLAQAIYFEARGESTLGKLAVAHVVLNRVKHSKFPNTICEVVKQKKPVCQFSWYCDGKSDILPNNTTANTAKNLAAYVTSGKSKDITKNSIFFHATSINPNWKKVEQTVTIGNHIFYRGR